ncbi:MAG TPA: alpha,alpha-phosphotrehalase [Cerasibacillus sp.]|uniref:alpha,alpha-phosphotrehalase n=1 Tax=Cerasibacillus sp. TaxID=2498711 RepID=UPI002F3E8FFE
MTEDWWKQAVVYQIYPKSFNDTTGNGTGDLQGIIEKLDYLHELGIDVIWLTPVYESPQRDNGYDISNYYAIDKRYGTMEDFERLLTEVHKRDMRLIMDLVVNHTSTEHEWFKQAASSKENPFRDFYIWKDAKDGGPPNNWQSKFGGSAWQWDERTEQYYLHLFDQTQADLNWENPVLREKVFDMMRFWAEKGIDGFRLDVINLISKDQSFPDDSDGDGRKFYTDGPKIHEYLHEMNQKVLTPYNLLTVGEMSSTSLNHCIQYTNPDNEELNMVFQFHHLKVDYPNGEKWTKADFDFLELKNILSEWQVGMHNGNGWNALFWCNHDQPRVVSRFGDDRTYWKESAKMLATTLHMMQGTPYIYQGEEIGMTNPNFDQIDQYRDVESINAYKMLQDKGISAEETMAILQQKSRDNARTPMQWDNRQHAGFTDGTPWIDVANNYQIVNVVEQLNDDESIFYHYKSLIELRKTYGIVVHGDFQLLLRDDPHVFAYVRRYQGETLLVVSHFYNRETHVSLDIPHERMDILLSNYEGSSTNINNLVLRPYESIIYLMR